MGARVVTASEILDGHVALDIECLDRVYLNAYVLVLQSSGLVVAFMTQYLGLPIPSRALLEKISQRFRCSVASFAEANDIPWGKLFRPQHIYAGDLLSAIEAIDAGVTTGVDWSHNLHTVDHADADPYTCRDKAAWETRDESEPRS